MTQKHSRLRAAHRVHAAVTIAVVITLAALNLSGVLSAQTALLLLIAVEVPLLLVLAVITVLRFRGSRGAVEAPALGFLDRVAREEPLLRPAVSELRAFQSLLLVLGGRRRVRAGAEAFGYTRGTMTFPAVMVAVSLVEMVVVHILVPWQWLRIVLFVLTVWGVLFILGFFASRIVHPHFVTGEEAHLRWGDKTVLVAALSNVRTVALHTNHAHTQPHVEDERLILTQFQSTNVLVRFHEPVPAAAPVSRKLLPPDFRAAEVHLYVDDPDAFVRALGASLAEASR